MRSTGKKSTLYICKEKKHIRKDRETPISTVSKNKKNAGIYKEWLIIPYKKKTL